MKRITLTLIGLLLLTISYGQDNKEIKQASETTSYGQDNKEIKQASETTSYGQDNKEIKQASETTKRASSLSEPRISAFCALIVNDTFEDAVKYLESTGVDLKDVYQDIRCGTYKTTLVSYLVKKMHVRSFLMLRRFVVKNFGNDAFVELINVRSPFSSTLSMCPLGVAKLLLRLHPSIRRLQKLQSLLIEYGAAEECD